MEVGRRADLLQLRDECGDGRVRVVQLRRRAPDRQLAVARGLAARPLARRAAQR